METGRSICLLSFVIVA